MNEKQAAMEVLDGVMLSDAGFRINGNSVQFNMSLSGGSHIDWLEDVARALILLGIEPCTGYPKQVTWKRSKWYGDAAGREYTVCRLTTKNSSYLIDQLSRWYSLDRSRVHQGARAGTKRVPKDLMLTPLTVAHWFMGDGSSYKYHRYKTDHTVSIRFATHGFPVEDVRALCIGLNAIGIHTTTYLHSNTRSGSGLVIYILQDSVDYFMNAIRPFILPSFKYKIKVRADSLGGDR